MSGRDDRPDPQQVKDALARPSREDAQMHFGAKPEEAAPDGSADAAVKRAAAGWSGHREEPADTPEAGDERVRKP